MKHVSKVSGKICGISLLMAGLISGCSIEQTNETKVSDLTYTIVEESETPEELKTMIEEKKRRILNLPMRGRMICISCGIWGAGDGRIQYLCEGLLSDHKRSGI